MHQELSKYLYDEFPELYRGRTKPMSKSSMCFGFGCSDGWFQLLCDLSADLMEICEEAGIEVPEVKQVKEKFGGLRYYVRGGNEATNARIRQAEEASVTICEVCGNPGKTRGVGRVQTLCDEHDV